MTCPTQLAFDLTPQRRRALDCLAPICQSPCRQTVCPYAIEAAREKFRRQLRRGRVVGPLPWFQGRWLETVEGFNPWREP